MNLKNFRVGVVCLGLSVAGGVRAAVTMSIIDPNAGSPGNALCEYAGLSASLNGSTIIDGSEWIGIYSFNVQSGSSPSLTSPFYTVCLSPNGRLFDGNYTYNLLTFAQANPGINPNLWQYSGTSYWGIQNANFLYQTFSGAIVGGMGGTYGLGGARADQGTALALAMYAALYNSTGYGNSLGVNHFVLNSANSSVTTDYSDILSALHSWNSSDLASGYVLDPTDQTAQEMILLGTYVPQGGPVPEPTTMISGAMLLLPFGASAFRGLRKKIAC